MNRSYVGHDSSFCEKDRSGTTRSYMGIDACYIANGSCGNAGLFCKMWSSFAKCGAVLRNVGLFGEMLGSLAKCWALLRISSATLFASVLCIYCRCSQYTWALTICMYLQGAFADMQGSSADMQGSFADTQASCYRICWCASIVDAPITRGHYILVWIYRALLQRCRALLRICRPHLRMSAALLFVSVRSNWDCRLWTVRAHAL